MVYKSAFCKSALMILLIPAALLLVAEDAACTGLDPSAVLLFPYYNTYPGNMTLFTLTNTGKETVSVHMIWIDDEHCTPRNEWITLTGKDTYTFLDIAVGPAGERGFMYAYVVENTPGDTNVLIGQAVIVGNWDPGIMVNFSVNAVGYRALDVTADGDLHLDGVEYEAAPKTVYFPRFFGQNGDFDSRMVLINLTGGKYFHVYADIMVYNDNEVYFSESMTFPCFWYGDLLEVSGATSKQWLLGTNQDPEEPVGFTVTETGSMEITGVSASYYSTIIENASIYALLIEKVGQLYSADRPWDTEDPDTYNNAMLWSTSPNGK